MDGAFACRSIDLQLFEAHARRDPRAWERFWPHQSYPS